VGRLRGALWSAFRSCFLKYTLHVVHRLCCGAPAQKAHRILTPNKALALIWFRALTWYSSPARPFAAPDDPLLVTGQQGSPLPRADSFPGLEMRARGAQAKKVPSLSTVPN